MTGRARPRVCIVGGDDVDARLDMTAALAPDFEFHVVGAATSLADRFAQAGVPYQSYLMSRRAHPVQDLRTLWQLVRILRRLRPELVHTFDTKPSVWGRIAARLAGVPIVIGTLPGLGSLYTMGWGDWKTGVIRTVYQPLQMLACHLSDLTIFQNEDDITEFVRRRVVARERAAVIPGSGVRTDAYRPASGGQAEVRSALHLSPDTVVVTMVSRVMRSKGVLEYAAAARAVRQEEPRVECLLVGPIDRESLDALTPPELEDVQRSVRWLGRRDDVRRILSATDIFVLPSYYREGVPRVLLEAAATGLPLVAADSPGSKDVIQDGVNGYLVPPQDSAALARMMLALVRQPALRRRFGEASRVRAVQEFDLSVIMERTRAAYTTLLGRRGRTAGTS